ncbi:MAG: sulfatase [Myxococcota bacterium]|nr:sulfatase [Myxococcota bacterium]
MPFAVLAWLFLANCGAPEPPPNILIYVVDTLRSDAVSLEDEATSHTPHWAALAEDGVTFENAYANASWTRASMASLMTGLLPWHHATESRSDRLPETARTLAELFAEHGYSTAIVSANPNVSPVFGFEQAVGDFSALYARSEPGVVGGHELVTPSTVVSAEAIRWLEEARRPFFLLALAIDPHAPYAPPAEFDPERHKKADPTADAARTQSNISRVRERYRGEVAFNDASFGQLVAFLKQKNLWEDTVVVLTSDHGEAFWEYGQAGHGKSLHEEVLRVPLILRGANDRLTPGRRVERPVSLIDLAPTLLNLAHLPVPEGLDGQNILAPAAAPTPILAGLDLDHHNLQSAFDPPYKLVRNLATGTQHLYRLDGPASEARPVDPTLDPIAREAQARLNAALDESQARTGRTLPKSRAGRIPGRVEESLRALGYIE